VQRLTQRLMPTVGFEPGTSSPLARNLSRYTAVAGNLICSSVGLNTLEKRNLHYGIFPISMQPLKNLQWFHRKRGFPLLERMDNRQKFVRMQISFSLVLNNTISLVLNNTISLLLNNIISLAPFCQITL
jgi:hypothetical protein